MRRMMMMRRRRKEEEEEDDDDDDEEEEDLPHTKQRTIPADWRCLLCNKYIERASAEEACVRTNAHSSTLSLQ